MQKFFDRDAMHQLRVETSLRMARFGKYLRSNDSPGTSVRNPEHNFSPAFIRNRNAIMDQLVEVILVTGLLELKAGSLRRS